MQGLGLDTSHNDDGIVLVNVSTEYREAFDMFDINSDNKISNSELRRMMESLGQKPTEKELEQIMWSADVNRESLCHFLL